MNLDYFIDALILTACLGWVFYDTEDQLIEAEFETMDWDTCEASGECNVEDFEWEYLDD